MQYILLNNRLVPENEACVPVSDRGFKYGDGVFETLAVHGSVPYRFEWHMARLKKGLQVVRIQCDVGPLREQCRQLLKKNALKDGVLRIQVTRGTGGKGYLPAQTQATTVIQTAPMPDIPAAPVSLWLSSYRKIPPQALPVQYKLTQGMNSTLARMEADDNGCFEALILNQDGHIAETSAGNIFWLKDKILYTPALACGVLEGSTRATIMELATCKVREAEMGIEVLASASAVFITNTLWKALPVRELVPDGQRWQSEEASRVFRDLLIQDVERYRRTHGAAW
jgi:branched-subunit amino acid aminotransferase/4-amino-4-deoxychorismate lyase